MMQAIDRSRNWGVLRQQQALIDSQRLRLSEAVVACKRLHLACGNNIMPGWVNIELEADANVFAWDLRQSFPIADGTIDYIFSEHFIEHISLEDGEALLRDCHRVLKSGGVIRLSTLDLAFVVEKYRLGETNEWANMGWLPATPCRMMNEVMRLWEHVFVFDRPELHALLKRAGFNTVLDANWRHSTYEALNGVECRPYHHELIVEAVRD